MSGRLTLHTHWRSASAYRVRLVLAYKQISFDEIQLAAVEGNQRTAQFAQLNPLRTVPVLVTPDNQVLTQSNAICEYLEDAYPSPPLLPKDLLQRAYVRQIAAIISNDIQPLQTARVGRALAARGLDPAAIAEFSRTFIVSGLTAVNKVVVKTGGTFAVGNEMTMADVFIVPQLNAATRFGVDVQREFPKLYAIQRNVINMTQLKDAHPKPPAAATSQADNKHTTEYKAKL